MSLIPFAPFLLLTFNRALLTRPTSSAFLIRTSSFLLSSGERDGMQSLRSEAICFQLLTIIFATTSIDTYSLQKSCGWGLIWLVSL